MSSSSESESESSSDESIAQAKAPPEEIPVAAVAVAKSSTSSENGKKSSQSKPRDWMENFNIVKPCIQEDGTMDYSSLNEEEQKRMVNWVKHQRVCYRKHEKEGKSALTDERIKLLTDANFEFKPSEKNKGKLRD